MGAVLTNITCKKCGQVPTRLVRLRPAPSHAFTLPEVLIAVTIVAVGLLGVAAGYSTALDVVRKQSETSTATNILREMVSITRNATFDSIGQKNAESFQAAFGVTLSEIVELLDCEAFITSTGGDPNRILLEVKWCLREGVRIHSKKVALQRTKWGD